MQKKNGHLSTRHYDNFPNLDSNIPTAPEYTVYIPQLRSYARACILYSDSLISTKIFKEVLKIVSFYLSKQLLEYVNNLMKRNLSLAGG